MTFPRICAVVFHALTHRLPLRGQRRHCRVTHRLPECHPQGRRLKAAGNVVSLEKSVKWLMVEPRNLKLKCMAWKIRREARPLSKSGA